MSEVFQTQMVIDIAVFQNMMTDEDYKNHIKKQLAYSLAERIIETNRASFTYIKDPNNFTVTVRSKVIL